MVIIPPPPPLSPCSSTCQLSCHGCAPRHGGTGASGCGPELWRRRERRLPPSLIWPHIIHRGEEEGRVEEEEEGFISRTIIFY